MLGKRQGQGPDLKVGSDGTSSHLSQLSPAKASQLERTRRLRGVGKDVGWCDRQGMRNGMPVINLLLWFPFRESLGSSPSLHSLLSTCKKT